MQISKGQAPVAVIFLVIAAIIAVVAVGGSYMPQVFSTPTTGYFETNVSTSEAVTGVLVNTTRQLQANNISTYVYYATGVVTNTSNGYTFTALQFRFNSSGVLLNDSRAFHATNTNQTNITVTYTYGNRLPTTWDSGTSTLWLLLGLLGIVIVFVAVLGGKGK